MKKIYTLVAAVLTTVAMSAQTFYTPAVYKGAFPITDGTNGTTSNNWTAGWCNWDPENKVYPAPTMTVSADITANTTWSNTNTYQLVGNISVKNGAVLTVQAGTVIKGDINSKSCLIITAGSKIIAQGTQTQPIVFTSDEAVGTRAGGDWGGLIILGNGITNTACGTCTTNPNTNYIEGFTSTFPEILYGGNTNTDSSGVLSFVRIEFAGVALSATPNSEINGLTMGGVGSKTKIDHIQVSFSGDDSFEWFGGAVDAKYLVAFRGLDDDFDTDFGYAGRIQFGLALRDKDLSDAAGDSNGFESDNFSPGSGRTPITKAVFDHMTIVGPKRDGSTTLPVGEKFERGAYIRRNSAISVCNSIFVGWEKGLGIKDADTYNNFGATSLDSAAFFNNNELVVCNAYTQTSSGFGSNAFYAGIWGANDSTHTVSQISWVNAFPTNLNDTSLDFRLSSSSSVAATGASFTNSRFAGQVLSVKNNYSTAEAVTLYPNPAQSVTTLSFHTDASMIMNIAVYDITGKMVSIIKNDETISAGQQTITISTEKLSSGVYLVSLNADSFNKVVKLIVE